MENTTRRVAPPGRETDDYQQPSNRTFPALCASGSVPRKSRITRQLEILALRSFELADRVADGELELIDAVDVAYEAAICAGLAETAGAEVVQTILAEAFRHARKAVQ